MATKTDSDDNELIRTWAIPASATFGSAVRAKGIVQEISGRLPAPVRKLLDYDVSNITLTMPHTSRAAFRAAVTVVSSLLDTVANLPVIPREIEDILAISSTERRRWLEDGRLPSAGTRTVRLRGRAKALTFHVFELHVVEDVLDRGLVDEWREHDREAAAENRRRAAYERKLTTSLSNQPRSDKRPSDIEAPLEGWGEFGADGLLR